MSDLWIPVIAALGASLLTGTLTFGLEWWRSHRADKAARIERRNRAYILLLVRSAIIIDTANGLHITMEIRSGVGEGVRAILGKQTLIDPLEFMEQMRTIMQPLYEAWSEVWTMGSKEAIVEANDLVARCGRVIGAATQRGEAVSDFVRVITGEKWTPEQLAQLNEEIQGLIRVRKRVAAIARREAGEKVADLFTSNETKEIASPASPSHAPAQANMRDSAHPS